jgi:hypothetical protein
MVAAGRSGVIRHGIIARQPIDKLSMQDPIKKCFTKMRQLSVNPGPVGTRLAGVLSAMSVFRLLIQHLSGRGYPLGGVAQLGLGQNERAR